MLADVGLFAEGDLEVVGSGEEFPRQVQYRIYDLRTRSSHERPLANSA